MHRGDLTRTSEQHAGIHITNEKPKSMNRLSLCVVLVSALILFSCSKEESFETGIGLPAIGSLKDSSGNCGATQVNGVYMEQRALTSSNTISVTVNVTGAGSYEIKTDTVNGFSFSGSGFISAPGEHVITLTGNGTPAFATATAFTVHFGTSFCDITVNVTEATTGSVNSADTAWMFNDDSRHYQGHIDSAVFKTDGSGIAYLNIHGKPATNDTTLFIQLMQSAGGASPTGSYSSSAGTAIFEFKTPGGTTIYDSRQADGSNLTFTISAYDPTSKILEGTFSGTVKEGSVTKALTAGKLKLQVQ